MCYTNLQMYVYPNGYQETFASPHLCSASTGGQLCPRHNFVTLAPMRVPFPNQVPQAFRNPASGYSPPFMGQVPPTPTCNPHMYSPSPPYNPHFSASGPRHSTDEKSTSSRHQAKQDTQPRRSTSRRPTVGEEQSHRRRDKARIVIEIDMADDSSYEEQPAEHKRSHNHCNHHCHSDDDKVPHQRRSQRHEPKTAAGRKEKSHSRRAAPGEEAWETDACLAELRAKIARVNADFARFASHRPEPPPKPDSSPPPFHSGLSNEAKAARDQQEIEELRETVRRLKEREAREKMREEREWEAQRRRSEEHSSRPRRRTTARGCDCYYQNEDYRWY
ncbi:hypothetical protein E4U58_000058 [Claviceps cyperi]|nr:hypothetical protein E4U58_000058 [Claviceps cyperi]